MNALSTTIYETLTQGTALRALLAGTTSVYNTIAPQGAAFPFVVFNQQAATSEMDDANDRGRFFYQVQAIGTIGLKASGAIMTQVDVLLHDTGLAVAGYATLTQRRTGWLEYVETDGAGLRYYHAGAIYQFRLTTT
jgi:hypothetical protein